MDQNQDDSPSQVLGLPADTLRKRVLLLPDDDPRKPGCLSALGDLFMMRNQQTHNKIDLDKAISLHEAAVRLTPAGSMDMPARLHDLGTTFLGRFERLGNLPDIDKSIELIQEALRLTPDGDADKPTFLSNIGKSFFDRSRRLGSLADLEKSIELMQEAVRLTLDGHVDKPLFLNNLGNAFLRRFWRLGSLADVDKSIELKQEAVQLTPDGDANKPSYLSNLGNSFLVRFERLGSLTDLEKSIELQEEAVRLTQEGDADKPAWLSNLGESFMGRFGRLGSLADLEKSIELKQEAVRLTPDGDPNKPVLLSKLGLSLLGRLARTGGLADLDKSIELQEEAVRLTQDGDAVKSGLLNALGATFMRRFERLRSLADINKAIQLQEEALQLIQDGDVNKPALLSNIGESLLLRFKHLENVVDLHSATSHFSCAASSHAGEPSIQFRAAVRCADCNHMAGTSPMDAYSYALTHLPHVAWLGLPVTGRHDELIRIGDVACAAAAAAIEEGHLYTAVEWLEQGRSVVWGQLLNLRSPVHALRERNSGLADRLEQTSNALERVGNGNSIVMDGRQVSSEEAARMYRSLAMDWDKLVDRARAVSGFENFLRPKAFSSLTSAAHSGPVVVINVHERLCDALILRTDLDDVMHVPLRGLSYDRAKGLQDALDRILSASGVRSGSPRDPIRADSYGNDGEFEEILSELWLHIVKPVLDGLAFPISQAADPPRIWWCPTGPLTFLPLHAAGLYDTDEPGHSISDFVTSSYTPTLTALLDTSPPIRRDEFELLAITQPSTPGQTHLPGTEQELSRIQECAGKLRVRSLRGAEATVGHVVEAMKHCGWIHLACHGAQDVDDPTNSAFFLQGGRLTLSEIMKTTLPHAELAFLSACKTASGDKRLPEEAVHLAAGMLLAGYRSVIATTWSIKDNDAPLVAEEVYGRLLKNGSPDSTQAAHALHHAVRRLRKSPGVSFTSWVPFIHVGM